MFLKIMCVTTADIRLHT